MKLVTTQPTTGQFVAVWSSTYMWKDGKLYQYAPDDVDSEGEWVEVIGGLAIANSHQHLLNYIVK